MATKFDKLKKDMLADPAARAEYDRLAPEYEIASALITARKRAKLSQEQLAQRMKTTQTAIARMESGRHMPSMKTITRYAKATGSRISFKLVRA
jgi:ribosome-binding protein aMBF1 (putative translation factor)